MSIGITSSVLILCFLLTLFYLLYVKYNSNRYTKERYCFSCLLSSVSLLGLGVTNISSREGFADHIYRLVAELLGERLPPSEPASVVEQIAITALVMFGVHKIWSSPKNWDGLRSVDDIERERKNLPNSTASQGVLEAIRLIKRAPSRQVFERNSLPLLQAVLASPSHDIVWHEHARQLFELWEGAATFKNESEGGWDERLKCWYGHDRRTRNPLILFCPSEQPPRAEIEAVVGMMKERIKGKFSLFIAVREALESISNETLLDTGITTITEDYLLDHVADFSDYCYDINRRVEETKLPESSATINDVYVLSNLGADGRTVSDDMESYLSTWSADPSSRQIVILGEYGQGKSTGAIMFTYHSIKSQWATTGGRVPILLELRGKSPANLLPAELIATWAQQYRLQALAIIKLLMAGRLILIFEGFDEMANVSDMESRVAHFRSLWRLSFPKSKLVFTGRRNLFFLEEEIELVFGGMNRSPADPYCEILHLRPFDIDQISHGLRWTDPSIRDAILRVAQGDEQVFDIVSRPSLLYIVARLWPELQASAAAGSMTSAIVISKFIEHSYRRQVEKAIGSPAFMSLLEGERRFFHEGLAVTMAVMTGTSNQITQPEFATTIERLYEMYPDDRHIIPPAMMEGTPRPLKIRLSDSENPVEQVATDVRTHGILVSDLARRGAFKFAHKSFFEALYAKVCAYSLFDDEVEFYNAIDRSVPYPLLIGLRRPEIIRFFSETFMDKLSHEFSGTRDQKRLVERSFDVITGLHRIPRIGKFLLRRAYLANAEMVYKMRTRRLLKFLLPSSLLGMMMLMITFISMIGVALLMVDESQRAHGDLAVVVNPSMNWPLAISMALAVLTALMITLTFVSMLARGSGVTRTDALLLWATVYVMTNREDQLRDNSFLSRRATEALIVAAREKWKDEPSQYVNSDHTP